MRRRGITPKDVDDADRFVEIRLEDTDIELLDVLARVDCQVIVDGEIVPWKTAFGWINCYKESRFHPIPWYCHQGWNPRLQPNPWGCKFNTDLCFYTWRTCGHWEGPYTHWVFEKERIWVRLMDDSAPYHLCPRFSRERLEAVIAALPDTVELPHPWWEKIATVLDERNRPITGLSLGWKGDSYAVEGWRRKIELVPVSEATGIQESPDYKLLVEGIRTRPGEACHLYDHLLQEAERKAPGLTWPQNVQFPPRF